MRQPPPKHVRNIPAASRTVDVSLEHAHPNSKGRRVDIFKRKTQRRGQGEGRVAESHRHKRGRLLVVNAFIRVANACACTGNRG